MNMIKKIALSLTMLSAVSVALLPDNAYAQNFIFTTDIKVLKKSDTNRWEATLVQIEQGTRYCSISYNDYYTRFELIHFPGSGNETILVVISGDHNQFADTSNTAHVVEFTDRENRGYLITSSNLLNSPNHYTFGMPEDLFVGIGGIHTFLSEISGSGTLFINFDENRILTIKSEHRNLLSQAYTKFYNFCDEAQNFNQAYLLFLPR